MYDSDYMYCVSHFRSLISVKEKTLVYLKKSRTEISHLIFLRHDLTGSTKFVAWSKPVTSMQCSMYSQIQKPNYMNTYISNFLCVIHAFSEELPIVCINFQE